MKKILILLLGFTIFSLWGMEQKQEAFVVQLEETPQMVSVAQWLAHNVPTDPGHAGVVKEYATIIATSQHQLTGEQVIKELFALQTKKYNATVSKIIQRHNHVACAFHSVSIGAIALAIWLFGNAIKCAWN